MWLQMQQFVNRCNDMEVVATNEMPHWAKLLLNLVVTFYSIYDILNLCKRKSERSLWQIKRLAFKHQKIPPFSWFFGSFIKRVLPYQLICYIAKRPFFFIYSIESSKNIISSKCYIPYPTYQKLLRQGL